VRSPFSRIHADLLGERARVTPEREALVDLSDPSGTARHTYGELDERATSLARVLRGPLALSKGDRVAILAHNRIESLDALFAAARTGVVLVTLGARLTAAELEAILRDCGAKAVLWDGAFEAAVAELRGRLPEAAFVGLDDSLPAAVAATATAEPFERTPCDGEDLCCLLYTSGTTGRPKGVMIPHRQVAWNAYGTAIAWGLREDDVSPVFTPLYHAGGLFAFLTPIFAVGGTVVLHPHFDAGEAWRAIEAEGATVVLGVPTIWKLMAEDPAFDTADLSRVRWLISGGAPLPEYLIETFQNRPGGGVPFKQGFGMTEVGVNCFTMTVEQARAKRGSIGRPMPFTEVRLVDEEGRDVPPAPSGTVGEMLFRGPHVCLGYWNDPEATAAALDEDGWFHSGDLARRDEDGFFYVAGRRKEMLISGGVNVFPAEIEAALLLHPAVEDAAVVGVPHDNWGEAGIAFVVPRSGEAAPDAEALGAFLGERLARYKLPKDYRFLDALPRTAYGKVVKGELREQYLAETAGAD
jgi:fatty-acyl-CoA synthase